MGPWPQRSGSHTLTPLLRERSEAIWRGSGFGRTLMLRRIAAAVLVGLAGVLALSRGSSDDGVVAVVVAAQDLAPGTVVAAGQVTVRGLAAQVVPDGAARSPAAVLGRTLAAPIRRGEPLTDVRLIGADLTRAVSRNPAAVSVPLRLADPGVAALLHPGAAVDVVTMGEQHNEPMVLARNAQVLAVLGAGTRTAEHDGALVLVALDPVAATKVAATSISRNLTVTVH
jgi:Flp pilus assembly protein CpaB